MEECRITGTVLFATNELPSLNCSGPVETEENPVKVLLLAAVEKTKLGTALGRMANETLTREKLEISARALARVLRAVLSGQ